MITELAPARLVSHTPQGRRNGFVIVLPGGGYGSLAAAEGDPVARWLAAAGIPAGTLEYAVAPATYPEALSQVLVKIAELRKVLAGPIGVLGFSAGGHLAGLAATATPEELELARSHTEADVRRPDALVSCYSVTSFVSEPNLGTRSRLTGGDENISLARRLSIELRIDEDTPPTFAWHTAEDQIVPASHSLVLATALAGRTVPVEFHLYPEGGHGLALALTSPEPTRSWTKDCLRWLRANGFG